MTKTVKKLAFLVVALLMFISFGCSSAFAASCLFGHKAVETPATEATCTENGSYGGSYCSKCGDIIEEATVIPATGHTQSDVPAIKPATVEFDGECSYSCVNCNIVLESIVIPKIDSESVKLVSSEVTYNGENMIPDVTVYDAEGKALIKDTDYIVAYAEDIKMPGIYTVTVTFIGNYEGEENLLFTIAPEATTGGKAKTITSSAITLKWDETPGATGYRVYQYSPSKGKYVLKKSLTATSYKVTGLKGSTSYNFKIRPYTKTADGTVIWGADSEVYTAKTKSAYSINITTESASIYVGATKTLKATVTPKDKTVAWKSSDTSVAKVSSSGKVTAVKKGTATITAYYKYNGKTYKDTCEITVKKPSVKLNKTSATIKQGSTLKLTATTTPADLKVTWKSSNTAVATVSSGGKVTARRGGTATITASFTYKGATYKKTCKVTVNQATPAENITRLINYIEKNGSTNKDGNKLIKIVDDRPEYESDCTFSVIYDKKNDCLVFILLEEISYFDRLITAELDRNGNYMDYKAEFVYYDYYGDPQYYAIATDTIKPSDYWSEYSLYDYWDENTFPSELRSVINEYLYVETDLAMTCWDYLMLSTADICFKDLGFTKITH